MVTILFIYRNVETKSIAHVHKGPEIISVYIRCSYL